MLSVHVYYIYSGKRHVDAYVRASYMSEEAMLDWVRENYQSYSYRQILGEFAYVT